VQKHHITLIFGTGQDAPRMHARESNRESTMGQAAAPTTSLRQQFVGGGGLEEKAYFKHSKEVHVIVILLSEKNLNPIEEVNNGPL